MADRASSDHQGVQAQRRGRGNPGGNPQGGFGGNSSGDIFVAFSTANERAWFNDQPETNVKMLPNDRITPLFQATAQATEAAITNALLAAETTTGANDLRIYALPVDRMLEIMKKYGADILRLWVCALDYKDDTPISEEILARCAEAYRKIRNTARYLISNLYDFDPARDVPAS